MRRSFKVKLSFDFFRFCILAIVCILCIDLKFDKAIHKSFSCSLPNPDMSIKLKDEFYLWKNCHLAFSTTKNDFVTGMKEMSVLHDFLFKLPICSCIGKFNGGFAKNVVFRYFVKNWEGNFSRKLAVWFAKLKAECWAFRIFLFPSSKRKVLYRYRSMVFQNDWSARCVWKEISIALELSPVKRVAVHSLNMPLEEIISTLKNHNFDNEVSERS